MPLIYITGMPGAGKSTVLEVLKNRGYEAYGTDEHDYSQWINKKTRAVDILPKNQQNFDIHKWFREHEWTLDAKKIKELKESSDKSGKLVLLLGVAWGEKEVWHLFDKVFALVIDEKTLHHRITNRTNNDFGKHEEELAHILKSHKGYDEKYRGFGATLVDATQPIEKVANDIIGQLP